jgi:hypothetical protein
VSALELRDLTKYYGNDLGIDGGHAITLLLATVGLIFSAVVAFNRRDISS